MQDLRIDQAHCALLQTVECRFPIALHHGYYATCVIDHSLLCLIACLSDVSSAALQDAVPHQTYSTWSKIAEFVLGS